MYADRWKLEAKCFNDSELQAQLRTVREGFGYDPFFPVKGESAVQGKWAKNYCKDCPVRISCLAEGMKGHEDNPYTLDGIWGGLTAHGRAALRKKQRQQVQLLLGLNLEQSPDTDNPIAS